MRRLLVLAAVLSALLVVAWVVRPIDEDGLRDFIEPAGAWAPLLAVVAGGVLGALLIPGPLLAGASGLLFGVWEGFFVTLASATLSAVIAQQLGRRAGGRAFEDVASEKVLAVALAARRHGTWAVVGQRLLPVVPDGPCNWAFGVVGVSTVAVVLGSIIGSSPRAFAYTALGDSLDDPFSPLGLVAIGIVVLTGAGGLLVLLRMRGRSET
jgi:uncharacterized membrane protein YdjX (TVP38/TMEM64 family)